MKIPAAVERITPRFDPRQFQFPSRLHSQRNAAVLGIALGVCFFTCFFTGLISHFIQHPTSWFVWPSRPAGFYRFTQGLHVFTGIVTIPLLLAKLWTVYPKLFEWPPVKGVPQLLERLSLLPLIGGGLFQLGTGLANISQWYFFPFFFTTAHYAMAWVVIGALIVHIGAKASIVRLQVRRQPRGVVHGDTVHTAVSRRSFLGGVFGISGVLGLFTVGQSYTPLGDIALLAPRRPGVGPQGVPINKTASGAGVTKTAVADDYRLEVVGKVTKMLSFTLAELRALPQHHAELPIACVEGWSVSANWSGVQIRTLLAMAGAAAHATARVESLEKGSIYSTSDLNRYHAGDVDALLALDLNGTPLDIDHGFPCRLIGPNRPGVMQTKWVHRLVVL